METFIITEGEKIIEEIKIESEANNTMIIDRNGNSPSSAPPTPTNPNEGNVIDKGREMFTFH
jgi:hypothetical protein